MYNNRRAAAAAARKDDYNCYRSMGAYNTMGADYLPPSAAAPPTAVQQPPPPCPSGQFQYSSSSLYSYTPTTTDSDCPEHGNSHRTSTIVLALLLVMATVGVMAIGSLGAYLGVLSKSQHPHNNNISITTSLVGESLSSSREDATQHPTNYDPRYLVVTSRASSEVGSHNSGGGWPPIITQTNPHSNHLTLEDSSSDDNDDDDDEFRKYYSAGQEKDFVTHPAETTTTTPTRGGTPPTHQNHAAAEPRPPPTINPINYTDPLRSFTRPGQIEGGVDLSKVNSRPLVNYPLTNMKQGGGHQQINKQNHNYKATGGRLQQNYTSNHRHPVIIATVVPVVTTNPPQYSFERREGHTPMQYHHNTIHQQNVVTPPITNGGNFIPSKPMVTRRPADQQQQILLLDRVSSSQQQQHYSEDPDDEPWRPLIMRQTLDKRGRVETPTPLPINKPSKFGAATAFTPLHPLNREKPPNAVVLQVEGDSMEGDGPLNLSNEEISSNNNNKTGETTVANESEREGSGEVGGENDKEIIDNPIRHGYESLSPVVVVVVTSETPAAAVDNNSISPSTASTVQTNGTSGDDETNASGHGEYEEMVAESDAQQINTSEELRPISLPSYTLVIPHIPNPSPPPPPSAGPISETSSSSAPAAKGDKEEVASKNGEPNYDSIEKSDEEDYNQEDDSNEHTNIYRLDLSSPQQQQQPPPTPSPYLVDIIPDRERPLTAINKLRMEYYDTTAGGGAGNTHYAHQNEGESPPKPAPSPTTPSITTPPADPLSPTLGSLNLVKHPSTSADTPPPPTRSYSGINQPLRPKPEEDDSDSTISSEDDKIILLTDTNFLLKDDGGLSKKVRFSTEDNEQLAAESLNRVLSMMMRVGEVGALNQGQDQQKVEEDTPTTHHNVHLLLSTNNSSTREQKSLPRQPKLDQNQFRGFSPFSEHVIPVPLIIAAAAAGDPTNNTTRKLRITTLNSTNWSPTNLTSIRVTNSPVYKFILRRGQTVEELLREIFTNYTEKGVGVGDKFTQTVGEEVNMVGTPSGGTKGSTAAGTPAHQSQSRPPLITPHRTSTPTTATTTTEGVIDPTSNATTIDAAPCPPPSFLCGNNQCISNNSRCNGVRECRDGSDETNCRCVDYLRAQMLHRKICDGVPDCHDLSDEYSACSWCQDGMYICSGSRTCIERERICDSKRDCPLGDDEADCVKIGVTTNKTILEEAKEDLAPIYTPSGYLMVRKNGVWGKLCLETFSTSLAHWEIKDLARAVCKAKTYTDFETVERVVDQEGDGGLYYELYEGNDPVNGTRSRRSTIGFKNAECRSRLVVKVTCGELQCGTAPRAFTQTTARIVGGSNSALGKWPWQAALYRNGEYQCGATLISNRYLLSAGHCFYHAVDDYWVARLGTLRRGASVLSPYEQVVKISHVFLHREYKDVGFVNDVSLLRLEEEVEFTDFVRPVCLPGRESGVRDGRMCTVVGWGQLFEVGRVFPDTLQEVQLPLISTAECRKRTLFLPLYKLTDQMFCAGYDRGGRDACLGDSGGPLMCGESDGKSTLYGVTSNGYGCARANRPGVYTKVASYLEWIYEKMGEVYSNHKVKSGQCEGGYRCELGECLPLRKLCNGFSDCDSGEDERNCTWAERTR